MMMDNDEDLQRQALDKVLREISDSMDEEDARRLREEIDHGQEPSAENPVDVSNLAVDGSDSEAELQGGHAGNLAAGDVDSAEGEGEVSEPLGSGSDAEAVREGDEELSRAASVGGPDTPPDISSRQTRRRRRFRR